MEPFLHWLAVHTGTLNEPGPYYGFFSGFGSDIGELAIIGGLVSLYRKHTCHKDGCWRISRHVVDGSPWCNRHHQAARDAVAPVAVTDVSCGHCARLADQVADLAEAVRVAVAPRVKP